MSAGTQGPTGDGVEHLDTLVGRNYDYYTELDGSNWRAELGRTVTNYWIHPPQPDNTALKHRTGIPPQPLLLEIE